MKKLLIANRGEIACRIAKTCDERGIETVAVYSTADEGAYHTRVASHAVLLEGNGYLDGSLLVQTAIEQGCDAIHPGYGFLSERGDVVKQVEDAGLTWVGPPSDAVSMMGDKIRARACAIRAGVSVVPGYDEVTLDSLHAAAHEIGYPVLLKATAGGGGRGMRVVYEEKDLHHAFTQASDESASAFGDGRMFMERYIEKPRHIEVQLVGDKTGDVLYFGVRECTLQRRHQKVIEEAPSLVVDAHTLQEMGACAVSLAKEAGYHSAGTVEFIWDEDGSYYFLEMNTRLQVEHPVTEEIYGIDLVGMMLDVAQGKSLSAMGYQQHQIQAKGWSFEARLCAEDPVQGFLPSFGTIDHCVLPATGDWGGAGRIRIDTGIEEGDNVSLYYDPMFAKIITWGKDRDTALSLLQKALDATYIGGIESNLGFLARLIAREEVQNGDMTTGFIGHHYAEGLETELSLEHQEDLIHKFIALSVKLHEAERRRLGSEISDSYGLRWKSGDISLDVLVTVIAIEGNRLDVCLSTKESGIFSVESDWQLGEHLFVAHINDEEFFIAHTAPAGKLEDGI